MKVEITKQLMLDAIESENIDLLNPGQWINASRDRIEGGFLRSVPRPAPAAWWAAC